METVPKRIYDFLARERVTICDDCIKARLGLANRNQASQATSAFGVTPLFDRYSGRCDICGNTKIVISPK